MSITGRLSAELFQTPRRSGLVGAWDGTELFMRKKLNPFWEVATSSAAGRFARQAAFSRGLSDDKVAGSH